MVNIPSVGWVIAAAAAAIFVLDMLTPLGIAVPMLYVIPILLTWLVPGSRITAVIAGCSLFLIVLGRVLSPGEVTISPGEVTIAVEADRAIASVLLLVVASLLFIQKQSVRQVAAMQEARDQSEERLRLFINYAPVALAMFDRDWRYLALSRRWMTDYGITGDVIGRSHDEVFSEMPEQWKEAHQRGLAGEIVRAEEDRFVRATGVEQWLRWEVRPWRVNDGQVGGTVIFTEDISRRKRDEEELRRQQERLEDLASRLLKAQEEERRRIARDLHDDITQRMVALTIDLQNLSCGASPSDSTHAARVRQLSTRAEELTTDLQCMAHRLHPSLLEHVGLEAAVCELVDEFEERTGLKTDVTVRDIPSDFPLDYATCIYRVLQESLQNIWKHAAATSVAVCLVRTGRGVGLCVHDDGRGFTPSHHGTDRKGLGLTSMEERVRALLGTFRVRTKPGDGTEIHAWVPLTSQNTEELVREGI